MPSVASDIARDDERIRLVVGFGVFREERRDAYRICLAFNAEGPPSRKNAVELWSAVMSHSIESRGHAFGHGGIPIRIDDAQGLAHPTAFESLRLETAVSSISSHSFKTSSVFAPTAGSSWIDGSGLP